MVTKTSGFKYLSGAYQPRKPTNYLEVEGLAREYSVDAIETLATIMKGADQRPAVRKRAADILLQRGWGKPRRTARGAFPRPTRDVSS